MVRGIAASYGHRPTAATTVHLLRRLVLEAGKLGAVDIASASLVQHLGGAVTERFATSAADALYAAYRMARLGIIVMDLCRPIPFQEDDVPERRLAGRQRIAQACGGTGSIEINAGSGNRLLAVAAGLRRARFPRLVT